MRLETLSYFIEIAVCGSFNKAAETLYVSQPNLSRTIHNFELELGLKLFDRSNRGIQLTEDGKKVFFYAKHIMGQIDSLETFLSVSKLQVPVKLSVSVCGLFLSGHLLNEYYETNQSNQMEFLLNEVTLEHVLDHVSTLQSELGIATVYDFQFPYFKRIADIKCLEYEEIGESPVYIHIGCKNPLFEKTSLQIEELTPYPLIRLPDDYFSNLSAVMESDNVPFVPFEKTIVMNNIHSIISLISSSQAIFIGNRWSGRDLNNDRIHSLPLANHKIRQKLLGIKRKQELLTPAAESFREIFLSCYQD